MRGRIAVISDLYFYLAAVPAVILVGLSKGGFGGGLALLGVPMMALVISPVAAAAILLPILLAMDAVSLYSWRGVYDRSTLLLLVPAGVAGILIGWAMAAHMSDAHVRLIVGVVAVAFVANYFLQGKRRDEPRLHNRLAGLFWGACAGFTSFIAHAGGPPFQFYVLPLRLDPKLFAGTAVVFFAIVNAIKVVPYLALGQFSATNLATSVVLMPLAPLSTLGGVWLVKRMPIDVFYKISYLTVLVVGVKLIWDGIVGLG